MNGIRGGSGALIDRLVLRTTKGKTIQFGHSEGGDEFRMEFPEGKHLIAFHGGHNGDLHNIGAWVRGIAAPVYGPPQKLAAAGGTHGDTNAFDDLPFLEDKDSFRIHSVRGVFENFCLGIEVTYNVGGELVSAGEHLGSNAGNGESVTLELDYDELIVNASGGFGALVDRLILKTNKGQEVRFGNSDGGDDFNFDFPEGKHIIGFHGGHNGDMHNIGVYWR